MTPQEMIEHCEKAIKFQGPGAEAGFIVPGRWGKSDTKRLCPGGPKGEIVRELERGCYCFFNAQEVLEFLRKKLKEAEKPVKPRDSAEETIDNLIKAMFSKGVTVKLSGPHQVMGK